MCILTHKLFLNLEVITFFLLLTIREVLFKFFFKEIYSSLKKPEDEEYPQLRAGGKA